MCRGSGDPDKADLCLLGKCHRHDRGCHDQHKAEHNHLFTFCFSPSLQCLRTEAGGTFPPSYSGHPSFFHQRFEFSRVTGITVVYRSGELATYPPCCLDGLRGWQVLPVLLGSSTHWHETDMRPTEPAYQLHIREKTCISRMIDPEPPDVVIRKGRSVPAEGRPASSTL